jgi:hypothetical protein
LESRLNIHAQSAYHLQNLAPRDRLEKFSKIEVSHFEIFDIGHILRAEHHTREVVSPNIMSLRKSIAAVMKKTTTASTGGTRRTRADDRADIRKPPTEKNHTTDEKNHPTKKKLLRFLLMISDMLSSGL